ncbi:hypothetical protein AVEN_210386-1 [Araneus ventricosus]|uniref:Uncharacterized protein n=1 Tax=Araneus ventricosus TaxID=182803 RepID=A0A4Y2RRM9_ARAVE|nr:hypothetical protein AVEN_210386-1 [Araneus ventricosus]
MKSLPVEKCRGKLSSQEELLDFDLLASCVTNMESRFPAMRVLRLGREFYRDKYGMASSSHVWFPDLGDEIWDLKGAGIFSIFPLGEKIRLNVLDNSM